MFLGRRNTCLVRKGLLENWLVCAHTTRKRDFLVVGFIWNSRSASSPTCTYFSQPPMSQCCRCNSSGRCVNCKCVKAGQCCKIVCPRNMACVRTNHPRCHPYIQVQWLLMLKTLMQFHFPLYKPRPLCLTNHPSINLQFHP